MLRRLIITLTLVYLVYNSYKFYNNYKSYKPILPLEREIPVQVAAQVGNYLVEEISGWTSPYAEVNLTGRKISRKTLADQNGFFAFYFVPIIDEKVELCLISKDVNQLPSFPVCLAPPAANLKIKIQNVLLSPSISVERGKIPVGETTKASGMTFPESEVDVYLFKNNFQFSIYNFQSIFNFINFQFLSFNFKFLKSAYAMGLPLYQIKSNKYGYFEFSLPANFPSTNRVFVAAKMERANLPLPPNASSPKSTTLTFYTLGFLGLLGMLIQNFFRQLIEFLLHSDPTFLIIYLQIGLLIVFLIFFKRRTNQKN